MIIFRGWRARKYLTDEVHNGITTSAKFTDDLELGSKFLVVCNGRMFGRLVGDEAKQFTLEGNSLANNVTGRKKILNVRRDCRTGL
jgi:hypothetical protein